MHEYYPAVSKQSYSQRIAKRFFGNPVSGLASYLTEMEKLSKEDLAEIQRIIEAKINSKPDEHE